MMGRLEQDQGQLFYSFCLEDVVPDDHEVRAIASVLDLSWFYGELSPLLSCTRPPLDRSSSNVCLPFKISVAPWPDIEQCGHVETESGSVISITARITNGRGTQDSPTPTQD